VTARRFPPPWSVEELDACFVVIDSAGQKLAYVYFEDEPGRRSTAKMLSKDEARASSDSSEPSFSQHAPRIKKCCRSLGSVCDVACCTQSSAWPRHSRTLSLRLSSIARPRTPGNQKVRQLGDVGSDTSRLISDTSRIAGNRHTEEKYEHTNRKGSKKTPVWAPRYGGLDGDDGPNAFLRRTFVQIERLYSQALHSQAT